MARPLSRDRKIWSCQSSIDKHSIRFAFGAERKFDRPRQYRGNALQLPEHFRGPFPVMIGQLSLFKKCLSHREG